MGMYIAINEISGWGGSGGVFDCIVEGTRKFFSVEQCDCENNIYRALDNEGQSFIVLIEISPGCFNTFYKNCRIAMANFLNSERGREVPPHHVAGILWNWGEVLRLMREDPRYRAEE